MPPPDLYAVLEKLLRGCEGPPAAVDNHEPLPSAKARCLSGLSSS